MKMTKDVSVPRPKRGWTAITAMLLIGAYVLTTLVWIGSLALLCLLAPFGMTDAQAESYLLAHVFTYGVYCVVGVFHGAWHFVTGEDLF